MDSLPDSPSTERPSGLLDIGAQAERTTLSWQRTGAAVIIIGLFITRWSVAEGFPAWPGVTLSGFGALAGLMMVRRRYYRVIDTVSAGQTPLSRFLVPYTTLLTVLVVLGVSVGIGYELMEP